MGQNTKTQIVTKLKTQILTKLETFNKKKTQKNLIVTKLKNINCYKTQKPVQIKVGYHGTNGTRKVMKN